MANNIQTRLADALERARGSARKEVVKSASLRRSDRELLRQRGYLQDICKGWYLLTRPTQKPGESTAWHAAFWDFLSVYLDERFRGDYCLSAVSSMDAQVGTNVVPRQVTPSRHREARRRLNCRTAHRCSCIKTLRTCHALLTWSMDYA